MNPEIRDQWATALESGKYTQGTDRLTTVVTEDIKAHCCLGVLCDLAVKAGVILYPETGYDRDGSVYLKYGDEGQTAFLPAEVQTWAGLDDNTIKVIHNNSKKSVDYLNDIMGRTFPEISALIRAQL
jgi:hypothetical protein